MAGGITFLTDWSCIGGVVTKEYKHLEGGMMSDPIYQVQVSPPAADQTPADVLTAAGCPPSTAQQLAAMGVNGHRAERAARLAQGGKADWGKLYTAVWARGVAEVLDDDEQATRAMEGQGNA